MLDDFEKGRRGESANVSNQDEYDRGAAFQRGLNAQPSFARRLAVLSSPARARCCRGSSAFRSSSLVRCCIPSPALRPSSRDCFVCDSFRSSVATQGGEVHRLWANAPRLLVRHARDQRMGERNASYRRVASRRPVAGICVPRCCRRGVGVANRKRQRRSAVDAPASRRRRRGRAAGPPVPHARRWLARLLVSHAGQISPSLDAIEGDDAPSGRAQWRILSSGLPGKGQVLNNRPGPSRKYM